MWYVASEIFRCGAAIHFCPRKKAIRESSLRREWNRELGGGYLRRCTASLQLVHASFDLHTKTAVWWSTDLLHCTAVQPSGSRSKCTDPGHRWGISFKDIERSHGTSCHTDESLMWGLEDGLLHMKNRKTVLWEEERNVHSNEHAATKCVLSRWALCIGLGRSISSRALTLP